MADLTRFDFNAFNFMHSEDVRAMTPEEVGQYVLLLCESWLTGKDASLVGDEIYLATLARTLKLSPRVLKKFQLVETQWGKRYRNEVLYQEWLKAVSRTNTASESGKRGAEARWGGYSNPNGVVIESKIAQTNPNQAIPNQSNPNQGSGDFKNLAVRYRRLFETKLGGSKQTRQQYADACGQYGEDLVLKMFEEWALTAMWIRDWAKEGKLRTDGLRQFYENLGESIAVFQEVEKASQLEQESHARLEEAGNQAVVAGQAAAQEKTQQILQQIEEDDEAQKRIEADPSLLFGKSE